MRIAIPADTPDINGNISSRFGRCAYFLIYDLDTDQYEFIPNDAANMPGGAGTRAAQIIISSGASAVVATEVGPKAGAALSAAGIRVYRAPSPSIRETIEYIKSHM